jgi:hypothetical protein
LTVQDDGIGMTDEVLKGSFWKRVQAEESELARNSGVIGTFGIGAMANRRHRPSSRNTPHRFLSSVRQKDAHRVELHRFERILDDRATGQ